MAHTPLSFDVVAIIDYVKKGQAKTMTEDESRETLGDIHTLLCRLLSSMLTSPLTGRMFISMHGEHQCVLKRESLLRQLE